LFMRGDEGGRFYNNMVAPASLSEISRAWQTFVDAGSPGEHTVSPNILHSWKRCVGAGVDPYDGTSHDILTAAELDELLDRHRDIIDVARPFMRNLYEFVEGSGFIVILTNEHGYIMDALGDKTILEKAQGLTFDIGSNWSEEQVGTNAIGTALVEKKPLQISGAEHFCRKHHAWTCSASPIYNRQGRLIAVLDMSGPSDYTHRHTLGMVVAAAQAIAEQIYIQKKNRGLTLAIEYLSEIFRTISDGVMVIDKRNFLTQINPIAEQIIGKPAGELIGRPIIDIMGGKLPFDTKATDDFLAYTDKEILVDTVGGRIHCLSSGVPLVNDDGVKNGGVIVVRRMEEIQKLVNRFSGAQAQFHFNDIIGNSPEIAEVIKVASLASSGSSNILLEGESGTGKEVLAQAIHNRSSRRKGPFVAVNCGAIPRDLIGSELFGYAEGAFTGAKRGGRPGKFELAAGGTLFLDEIGDMPLEQQVALLRVLQDRKITRIGDDKIIPLDFRLICATNRDLLREVEKGSFRQDLYYRINVVTISMPPLRKHLEDIPALVEHFIKTLGRRMGNRDIVIEQEVIEQMQTYHWPGNVRELQNVVERLINIAPDGHVTVQHLPSVIRQAPEDCIEIRDNGNHRTFNHTHAGVRRKKMDAKTEYQELLRQLDKHGGNITEVAREMGISRNTVYRKMRLYKIEY
ncbi:MAG TPA: sigma-54-dependent Fis family transcriptional regulator, partial [Syntrophomonas sp.]|nr:sigma-54-dependent Fis family transcriptional regulator [Syntrophomonas sp.]